MKSINNRVNAYFVFIFKCFKFKSEEKDFDNEEDIALELLKDFGLSEKKIKTKECFIKKYCPFYIQY